MKPIIVNGTAGNVAKLAAELDRVQSRARVRTVSAADVSKTLGVPMAMVSARPMCLLMA